VVKTQSWYWTFENLRRLTLRRCDSGSFYRNFCFISFSLSTCTNETVQSEKYFFFSIKSLQRNSERVNVNTEKNRPESQNQFLHLSMNLRTLIKKVLQSHWWSRSQLWVVHSFRKCDLTFYINFVIGNKSLIRKILFWASSVIEYLFNFIKKKDNFQKEFYYFKCNYKPYRPFVMPYCRIILGNFRFLVYNSNNNQSFKTRFKLSTISVPFPNFLVLWHFAIGPFFLPKNMFTG